MTRYNIKVTPAMVRRQTLADKEYHQVLKIMQKTPMGTEAYDILVARLVEIHKRRQ